MAIDKFKRYLEFEKRYSAHTLKAYKKDIEQFFSFLKDIYAIEQSYNTRKSEKSLFESHIKYIDFQFMIAGEEVIEVTHTDLLEVDSEYNEEGDYSLYKPGCSSSSKIIMRESDLSIFFSKDGHMPGIQSDKVTQQVFKTVVKVPEYII